MIEEMLKEFSKHINPNEQEQITDGHQIIDLSNKYGGGGGDIEEKKKKKCCAKTN